MGILFLCLGLSKRLVEHLPSWVEIPFPSYTILKSPETIISSIGIPFFVVGMIACLSVFHLFIRANVEQEVAADSRSAQMRWNLIAFSSLFVAGIGAIGAAVIHVQPDIFKAIHQPETQTMSTFINSTCGMMFILGATVHTLIMWLLISRSSHLGHLRIHWSHRFRVLAFSAAIFGLLIYILAQPLFGPVSKTQMLRLLKIGAAAQWISIVSFMAIFTSYSSDLVLLLESLGESVFVFGRRDTRGQ
mgnify:CR=1 FL=1